MSRVTSSDHRPPSSARLRPAIVVGSTEDACTVVLDEQPGVVPYAQPFPRPRAERVLPGHLVAVLTVTDGTDLVVWRWFDAVVLDGADAGIRLWEPAHGVVVARPREPQRRYRPGARAYLSAGLPDADWWVAGPAVAHAETADVELDEVAAFFTSHDLWGRLA
jgi:hypothetical protein